MVEAVWGRLLPIARQDRRDPGHWSRWLLRAVAVLRWAALFGALFLLGWGLATEARTSYLQSRLLSRWAAEMKFSVQPGPSEEIRFPDGGLTTSGAATRGCRPLSKPWAPGISPSRARHAGRRRWSGSSTREATGFTARKRASD
jgi:hypothetical protein